MTQLQKKQLAFLDDTVKHFNSSNRGIIKREANSEQVETCSYVAGCAVGRHIADKELCAKLDLENATVLRHSIFSQLPTALQSLGQGFLTQIQYLHDAPRYWTPNGLSTDGVAKYNEIKTKYSLV